MPSDLRPHLTTGGRGNCAEMPKSHRPRLILVPPQGRRNASQCSRQWEGSLTNRSNAISSSPFPTIQQGAKYRSQKCHAYYAPTLQQGATQMTQKCQEAHAPTLFGAAQHAQRCHSTGAPTTRGQRNYAEMPPLHRLAQNKEIHYGQTLRRPNHCQDISDLAQQAEHGSR